MQVAYRCIMEDLDRRGVVLDLQVIADHIARARTRRVTDCDRGSAVMGLEIAFDTCPTDLCFRLQSPARIRSPEWRQVIDLAV